MYFPPTLVIVQAAAVLAMVMVALWALSVRIRDVSIVDPFWGPGFALIAGVCLFRQADPSPRAFLVFALVTIWALRLGVHLLRRRGHGEDFRYAAMRERRGPSFVYSSLFIVFGLQGVLLLGISLPVMAAISAPATVFGPLDAIAAAIWLCGFLFEAIGDAQLEAFKLDPSNRGKVNNRGLWRYTRHPNYFGDALLWWGLGLFGVAVGAWPLLLGPAAMTFLLLRVSGVALLEKDITERRPAYREYIQQTSAFIPWFPRSTS
jgi:steroid 5-alpha reductase family enzyme